LSAFGTPGAAGTLAGQTPGVLLAGASACAKVRTFKDPSHTHTHTHIHTLPPGSDT
jgi:hypothetical protein